MRILILSQYFWPENFRINDLAESLSERGHQVDVVTGIPNYPDGSFFSGYGWFSRHPVERPPQLKEVQIVRLPIISRGRKKSFRLALNYLSFILTATFHLLFLNRNKYDCCLVYGVSPLLQAIPAVWLKIFKRVPLMIWVQDLWPESLSAVGAVKSNSIINMVGAVVRWIYNHCDMVLVQSEGFFDKVARWGAHREKTHYLPNWADEHVVGPIESRPGDLPTGFNIIFAGNLGKAQGLEVILGAAEHTRDEQDLNWVILGDGFEKDWFATEIKRRSLEQKVFMLGRKPPEKMSTYFAHAGGLLVTLSNDPIFARTVPSKVQSYLAAGKPVLGALDGEGARLINSAEVGIAGPALDCKVLAANALALKSKAATETEEIGRRAKMLFENQFRRGNLITRLESWMKEIGQ